MSFGFYRAEVLGAVTSIVMIWVLTGVLLYLAVERIRTADYEIDSDVMLIVSGLGVAMNIVMGLTLSDIFWCGKRSHNEESDTGSPHSHAHSPAHSHSHGHTHHGHSHANMNVRCVFSYISIYDWQHMFYYSSPPGIGNRGGKGGFTIFLS